MVQENGKCSGVQYNFGEFNDLEEGFLLSLWSLCDIDLAFYF